jgi:electron transfer flavoprotein alpha subunit
MIGKTNKQRRPFSGAKADKGGNVMSQANSVLVMVEQGRAGTIEPVSLECLRAGRELADELKAGLIAAVIGSDVRSTAEEVRHLGVDGVLLAEHPSLGGYQPDGHVSALVQAVRAAQARLVLMGDTATTLDLAPRAAFTLEAGLVTDCVKIEVDSGEVLFTKPVYSGNVMAVYSSETEVTLVTLRSRSAEPATRSEEGKGEITSLQVEIDPGQGETEIVESVPVEEEGVNLDQADIVVSGGRGIGGTEGFELLSDLAGVLGGALGASRPPVDCGWASPTSQVGQTGKIVAPSLYVAVGISGAMQHISGMSGSKVIVAINKTADANIFNIADYGVVGNYEEIVPSLTQTLKGILT